VVPQSVYPRRRDERRQLRQQLRWRQRQPYRSSPWPLHPVDEGARAGPVLGADAAAAHQPRGLDLRRGSARICRRGERRPLPLTGVAAARSLHCRRRVGLSGPRVSGAHAQRTSVARREGLAWARVRPVAPGAARPAIAVSWRAIVTHHATARSEHSVPAPIATPTSAVASARLRRGDPPGLHAPEEANLMPPGARAGGITLARRPEQHLPPCRGDRRSRELRCQYARFEGPSDPGPEVQEAVIALAGWRAEASIRACLVRPWYLAFTDRKHKPRVPSESPRELGALLAGCTGLEPDRVDLC